MKKIKLVAFDIDGTLIPSGSRHVSEKSKEAIQKLKANGIQVLVATGRIPTIIQDDIREHLNPDFYVTINGQLVVDHNLDTVSARPLDPTEVKMLVDYAKAHDINVGLKWEKGMKVLRNFQDYAKVYLSQDPDKIKFLSDLSDQEEVDVSNVYGVFFIGKPDKVKAVEPQLKKLVLSFAYDQAFEVFDPQVSKSGGIQDVLDHYNITWDEVISFGDAHNDIEMLKSSGIGVAMGNAKDEVKAVADYITQSVDDDGVYHALKHFNLI